MYLDIETRKIGFPTDLFKINRFTGLLLKKTEIYVSSTFCQKTEILATLERGIKSSEKLPEM